MLDTASPNSHGKALTGFLKCTNMCMLNGRFQKSNAYTSVSTRGLAVVDYCLVPLEDFNKFYDFKILSMLDIVQEHNIAFNGSLPDHSILVWNFHEEKMYIPPRTIKSNSTLVYTIPDNFLESDSTQSAFEHFVGQLEDTYDQEGLNAVYNEFCETLKSELIPKKVSSGTHHHKPWWNDHLASLRKVTKTALNKWSKNKENQALKCQFLESQKEFDSEVRKARRTHHRHIHEKLLSTYKGRPKDFWKQIDRLGIHKDRQRQGLPDNIKR